MRMTATRRIAALTGAAVLAVALAACGPAPWEEQVPETPAPTTSEPEVEVLPPVPNDLSSGSTERELEAGAVSASVNYWSSLTMDRWVAGAIKPISMSMITTITPNDGQKVYLKRAAMVVVPANHKTTFPPLEAQADTSAINPGYLVLSPYSYSQTFNVGPVPAGATFVTVQFTYDFLVQTTPTSTEYAKQTATDILTVAIAQTSE